MQKILYGKPVAEAYKERIAPKVKGRTLALLLVGGDGASVAYSKTIVKLTEALGGDVKVYRFPGNVAEKDVLATIDKLNASETVHGIMPLFPMPEQIDENKIADAILAVKDLDCLNSGNIGEFYAGRSPWAPATARACLAILRYYGVELEGKRAAVIGRSNVVGKPGANLLLQENCTVTVCHSHTKNLAKVTAAADILIAAVGRAGFVKPSMVKEGAVLIDVGINVTPEGIVGDVSPDCYQKASAYSPVPGGVGVVANVMLLQKLAE
ncbi:MAG: bifunctional 5,10-methylenetetrahydrofolate dehydrogenase/5,10-methenyltetrahydrofolate cyclohydrolase [Acidaminococcaceae bacterium]|nr:bifunctional 5,10-methylenetetrahydrofolate dehydrogenase/5,10-methenyltetrahydrofolate cyclohydrolase [Acidaminococcaceae bacterium]